METDYVILTKLYQPDSYNFKDSSNIQKCNKNTKS